MTDDIIDFPLAYLITFRCYGTWLHGDERGSIDRHNRRYGMPTYPKTEHWQKISADRMKRPPVKLTARMRKAVEKAIRETCGLRNWTLLAIKCPHQSCSRCGRHRTKETGNRVKRFEGELDPRNAIRTMAARCYAVGGQGQRTLSVESEERGRGDRLRNQPTGRRDLIIIPPATAGGTNLRSLLLCLRTPGRPRRDRRPTRPRIPTRVNRQKRLDRENQEIQAISEIRYCRSITNNGILIARRVLAGLL